MEIKLAYGKSGLRIRLPDQIHTEVIEPRYVKGFDDQFNAVREALEHPVDHPPLEKSVKVHQKVAVVFSDISLCSGFFGAVQIF